MKKICFLFITAICLLTACNDDFLDRKPGSNISDGNFWKSSNDMKLYANNFYNNFWPSFSGWGTIGYYGVDGDTGSDTQINNAYNTTINGERIVPQTGGGWSVGDWSLLRNVNYFIDNYHRAELPLETIKQYIAEALFFRSMFYFDKISTFGDVPWYSSVLSMDSEMLYKARDPRNVVVDSIMKDLDLAIEYLPVKGNWTGRITKEVALLYQARIALYEGTWEKYHAGTPFGVAGSDGKKYIQKAADAAKALMTLGTCQLDNMGAKNGYTILFKQEDYSSSKEVIFWKKYSVADNQYHVWSRYTGTGAGRGVTKSMIDSYLCTDGKPITSNPLYQGDGSLASVVKNRDPRLAQTICHDSTQLIWDDGIYFSYPGFEAANEGRSVTGYQLYKGHNPSRTQNDNSQCLTGLIYFRYAEALLIYAEAKAELGTITQDDVDKTINLLRERVGMNNGLLKIADITPYPNSEFPTLSPIINEIRRERKVELCCEGFRMDDLFRWAAADELIVGKRPLGAKKAQWTNDPKVPVAVADALKSTNYDTDSNGYIDPFKNNSALSSGYQFKIDRDYLSPLPISERVINPKLTQNPGWVE